MSTHEVLGSMQDIDEVAPPALVQDASAAAAEFNKQLVPDTPEIRAPEDGAVFLMHGLVRDGEALRHAVVRELRGSDEEAISKLKAKGTLYYALLEDMIVRRATESIGSTTDVAAVIPELLLGDRGLLFAHILLATYGPTKEYEEVQCPRCQAHSDIELDWFELLDIQKMKTSDPYTTVTLKGGKIVELRYPTGADQIAVISSNEDATDAEMNTLMLARCITNDTIPNKKRFVLDLSIPDRRKLVQAMEKNAPSVGFKECEVPCPSCNQAITWTFSWADLLLS